MRLSVSRGRYGSMWNPAFGALTASDFEVIALGYRAEPPSAPVNLTIVK